jgi:SAM-dependent methyltransferase
MAKLLKLLRNFFSLTINVSKKIIQFINGPLFYLEQGECKKFNDCRLLAKVLYYQPANSDRYLEYPWLLQNINIASGKILDVGSTASNMLYNFLPKAVEINSIDLNSKYIESEAIKFAVGDIRKTNYEDNYFDVVSCISTLEHIGVSGRYGSDDDPEGDLRAVKEMGRILKPGGTMLVTVPYGIRDVLPINKLYNKERIIRLFKDFSAVEIEYKKYFGQFNLWLATDEAEAAKTDMIKDRWYAIAFIKVKK